MAWKQAGQVSGWSGSVQGWVPVPVPWRMPSPAGLTRPTLVLPVGRVMQSITTYKVFPAWTPGAGEVLLCQVEQAVGSKSPGITSLVELLKECARSFHLQDEEEEEEEDGDQQQEHHHHRPHLHRAAPIVKAYILLCVFPTRVLVEEGGGDGRSERGGRGGEFDCCAFVKGLTYLFNLLLEHCRRAVLAQARLVAVCQLQVVVDEGGSISSSDDGCDGRQQKRQYTMDHRRTILKDLNELISLSVGVRADLKRQCCTLFTQLPGLLKKMGDYDTQASIVELIYRLTTSAERSCSVTQWFPELECTIQCLFLTISEFDPHCRRFLNAYNASLGDSCRVFTHSCHAVYIGKLKLCKPKSASYPRFWIDFNLDTSSILILCQVEGKSQPSDPWECLSIEHEEVEGVTLTRRMHSYTLEVEYSDLTMVEELFSSPLSSDSRALLSTVVFFEFSPQPLLEKLCILLFGDKLTPCLKKLCSLLYGSSLTVLECQPVSVGVGLLSM